MTTTKQYDRLNRLKSVAHLNATVTVNGGATCRESEDRGPVAGEDDGEFWLNCRPVAHGEQIPCVKFDLPPDAQPQEVEKVRTDPFTFNIAKAALKVGVNAIAEEEYNGLIDWDGSVHETQTFTVTPDQGQNNPPIPIVPPN